MLRTFIGLMICSAPLTAQETCYKNVCFPAGDVSFADTLIQYNQDFQGGCNATSANFTDPMAALGAPDCPGNCGGSATGSVALGSGGLIEVGFTDNVMLNSGTDANDLYIYETGAAPEAYSVAVRAADANTDMAFMMAGLLDSNADGFYEIGDLPGGLRGLDLDALVPGQAAGSLRVDAVQIVDDLAQAPQCTAFVGADVDAIGAPFVEFVGSPTVYCTGKLSSAGCMTTISVSDPANFPVSGASDYLVEAAGVQGLKNGLLFLSIDGAAEIPFGNGTLCMNPPLKRGPIVTSGGSDSESCDGTFSTVINDGMFVPLGLDVGAGMTARYQWWYRDPNNGVRTTATAFSDAVEVSFN